MSAYRRPKPPEGPRRLEPGVDVPAQRDDDVQIVGATLHRPVLTRARMDRLVLRDVEVDQGDLAVLAVPGASWQRVELRGCRLTSAAFAEATLQDVRFTDCKLDGASFALARLHRVRFEGCSLVDVDFEDVDASACAWVHCDLSRMRLKGARLDGCALRACRMTGLTDASALRGVQLTASDLLELAEAIAADLGLEVVDDVD